MKITKSRLLEIIKEEVELHNRNQQQEGYEFNVRDLMEVLADENDDGEISKKEFDTAIKKDMRQRGLEEEIEMEEGIEGVISLIRKKGKEGAVKALKDKKEIDNPWALVNAALSKMGKSGLSSKKEEILFDPKTKKKLKNKT